MSDINWGILQPLSSIASVKASTPEARSGSVPIGAGGGLESLQSALTENQRIALQKQELAHKIAYDNALLQMQQAKQPGELQNQQLVNSGLQQNQQFAAQRQPGILQNQSLVNQGLLTQNQLEQLKFQSAKQEYIH